MTVRRSGRAFTGYALVVLAAVGWATGGVSAKWLFERPGVEVDPVALSSARAFLAFVLLLVVLVMFRRKELRVRLRDLPFLAVFGVSATALLHLAYYAAIARTNVSTAILLEYLAPVLVLVVSVILFGERLTWKLPVGVFLSVTGCALVVGVMEPGGLVVDPEGLVWGLIAAGFFATYMLMGKRATQRVSPWTLLLYGLGFACLFWLLYPGGLSGAVKLLSKDTGSVVVLYIAVFATLVPFGAFLSALHHIGATEAGVTATLEPAFAGALAFMLLGETSTVTQAVGAALVLAAIIVVQIPSREGG